MCGMNQDTKLHCGLWKLKACIHADGVAEFISEDALLAVVGQLKKVEASGGGWETAAWLLLTNGEEATQDAA